MAYHEVEFIDELPGRAMSDERRPVLRVWEKRLAPVMARPGTWAKVRSYRTGAQAASAAAMLKAGRAAGVDPADWWFASRTIDGESWLLAMYDQ